MSTYKEMYLKLLHASENAIRTIVDAQRECEELYLEKAEKDKREKAIIKKREKQ